MLFLEKPGPPEVVSDINEEENKITLSISQKENSLFDLHHYTVLVLDKWNKTINRHTTLDGSVTLISQPNISTIKTVTRTMCGQESLPHITLSHITMNNSQTYNSGEQQCMIQSYYIRYSIIRILCLYICAGAKKNSANFTLCFYVSILVVSFYFITVG